MAKLSALEEEFYLHCRVDNLKAVRQYAFHATRKWQFDFAWPEQMIAVEIEGGVWLGQAGGHTSGTGYTNNCEKYNEAVLLGWHVLRFTPNMVKSGYAIETTKKLIKQLSPDNLLRAY